MPTKITLKDHQEKLKIKKRISFSTSPTPSYSKPLITYSSSSSLFCYWLLERRWIFSPFSIFLHSEWPMHESGIGGVVRAKRVSIGLVERFTEHLLAVIRAVFHIRNANYRLSASTCMLATNIYTIFSLLFLLFHQPISSSSVDRKHGYVYTSKCPRDFL